jgi:protein tyrosine phosphatase
MGFMMPTQSEWKLRKDKNGIKVYTRESSDGKSIEFKATTSIQQDIDKVLAIINKTEELHKWQTNLEEAKVIKSVSSTKWYEYSWIDLPWPFANRDAVMLKEVKKDSNGDVTVSMVSKPNTYPVQEDLVRMNTASGFWKLTKQNSQGVNVIYQFYADPEINMPKWLINMFIVDGPFETLTNLKELAEKS